MIFVSFCENFSEIGEVGILCGNAMQFVSLVSFCLLPRLRKSVWFGRVKFAACVYFQL